MKYKNFNILNPENDEAVEARRMYKSDIDELIKNLGENSEIIRDNFITPEALASDREGYRKKYIEMLAQPVKSYSSFTELPNVTLTNIGSDDMATVYRVSIEFIDNVHGHGLLFIPKDIKDSEKRPLIISQHGGSGTPELISLGIGDSYNYTAMTRRVLELGAVVYSPFMLVGSSDGPHQKVTYDRTSLERRLQQLGWTMTSLEICHIMRAIDWLCAQNYIDSENIGMIGLSWGCYYTIETMAADTRIKAGYASCLFNDRLKYNDFWVFNDSANKFCDAETAALIAPRRLYIEVGRNDIFDCETAEHEYKRLLPFYSYQNADDNLRFNIHNGGHEVDASDDGIHWAFDGLFRKDNN